MRKIYNANSTKDLLTRVLPSDFKMVKDKTSNGYQYMNALYGIEIDTIKDYLDQAKHNISFENFDYGLDFGYSEVNIPVVIESGYIYGDGNPIKITTDSEFVDGKPTRMIYNSELDIDISGYINNPNAGVNGMEYMRADRTGSGILYINTTTESNEAVISGYNISYTLPMTDLIEPLYSEISGHNPGIETQNYEKQLQFELIQPQGYDALKRTYPLQKYIYLPKGGISSNSPARYLVDYYKPEDYYWDEYNKTYKPFIPTRNTYIKDGKEIYYRVALNNPNGSGVYDTEYLELEYVPISGTLKVFDIDSVDDKGKAIEILQTGTQLYKYVNDDNTYTYVGYSEEVPYEEGLGMSGIIYASPYKVTSWDYVHEDDGLVNFIWEEDPSKPITNKIKIVNPVSRYFVEYQYVIDKQQYCITTMNCNRYVRYNDTDYLFSSKDITDNALTIDAELSHSYDNKRAVTFNGFDVRPGSLIHELQLTALLQKNNSTDKSASINITDKDIPGSIKVVIPNIYNYEYYFLKHNYSNQELTPSYDTPKTIFIGDKIGQHLNPDVGGLYIDKFLEFYNPNLTENRIIRTRFKFNTTIKSTVDIITSVTSDFSWNITIVNGYLVIRDSISTFTTNLPVVKENSISELMIISNGVFHDKLMDQRFTVLVSFNDKFFKLFSIYEDEYNTYNNFSLTDKTEVFKNGFVDLDFISIYDEGNLDGRNLL